MPKQNTEKQLVQIPMGAGLDESTPASILKPGNLSSCINGSISRTGSIEPRRGYSALPTIDFSGSTVLFKDICNTGDGENGRDGFVAFDAHNIYTFSEAVQRWNKVDYAPEAQLVRVDVGERGIQDPGYAQLPGCDALEVGSFRFHAWTEQIGGQYYIRTRVIDITEHTESRVQPAIWSVEVGTPRLLKSGTKAFVFYRDASATIVARVFDTTTPLSGWSAPVTIIDDLDDVLPIWEACSIGSDLYVAYNKDEGGLAAPKTVVKHFDLSLVLLDDYTFRHYAYSAIGVNGSSSDNILYVSFDYLDDTNIEINAVEQDDVSGFLWGPNVLDASGIFHVADSRLERIGIAINPAGSSCRVVFSLREHPVLGANMHPELRYWDVDDGGGLVATGTTYNVSMLGQPFFIGSYCYVPVMLATKSWHQYMYTIKETGTATTQTLPRVQGHAYILSISTGTGRPGRVVTRLCPYLTGSWDNYGLMRPTTSDSLGSGQYLMAVPKLSDGSIDIDVGFDVYRFTFGLDGDKRPVRTGPVSVFSGGVPTQWDGDRLTEVGWHYYPRLGVVADAAGAGGLVAGQEYNYTVVYVWEDAKGQRHFSTPALPWTHVVGVGKSRVSIEVDTLTLTDRQDSGEENRPVVIELYRTMQGPSQDYYFVARKKNDPTIASVTFTDTASDSTIATNKLVPTRGGVAPAGCLGAVTQFCVHNGRPFALMAEDSGQIAFGHFTLPGEAPRFPDGWTLRSSQGASYTAIGSMADKLIAWQRHAIDAIYGSGPNDTGAGGSYSDPQRICGTIGCSTHKSLVRYPGGYMFCAEAGWWTLDEGFGVEYRGAAIESTQNTYPHVQSAFLDDAYYRVVILCNNSATNPSAGVALVWFYPWNMWTRWEIPSTTGSALAPMVGGCVAYRSGIRSIYACTSSGKILREQGACQDHSTYWVTLDLTTGWLSPSGLQGFGHQWNVNVLGTYREKHVFAAAIYYDYDDTQSSTHSWTASGVAAATSGTRLQMCIQPKRTEAQSIKLGLVMSADPATAVTGACSRLEAITVEAASEPGIGLLTAEARR